VYNSGAYINNATNSINLGLNTYSISPSSINIGHSAGAGNSGSVSDTVNIGQSTGSSGQANQTIAIGSNAGATSQGSGAIAIGYKAQRDNVVGGFGSVSIGSLAGSHDVGRHCVSIGGYSGYEGQSSNSVAIGYQAGYSNQHLSSIIINATGAQLNSLANAAFYVAPVRNDITTSANLMDTMYNTSTKELIVFEKSNWSIITFATFGGYYVLMYELSLAGLAGGHCDMSAAQYTSNCNTGFGTSVWEGVLNPLTRDVAITLPYNGIYQINMAVSPVASSRIIVSLEIVGVKTVEVIDINGSGTTPSDTAGFTGTYYFPAGTILKLVDTSASGSNQVLSFSGHLVRRI
jgi:hypothetical protein